MPTRRFSCRIVFFAQQTDLVAKPDEAPKQAFGLVVTLLQNISVDQPEAAGQESAFARRQRILNLLGRVAQHEAVAQQLGFDRRNGTLDPRIGHRQKADAGQHQEIGVELIGFVSLHEGAALLIEAAFADLVVNFLTQLPPVVERTFEPKGFARS